MMKLRTVSWMLLAAFGTAASAAPGWVSTATHRTEVFSDGQPVEMAEEVAPAQEVKIAVSLKLRDRAGLDARVAAVRAGSANFIGREELAARYLPTAEQVAAVVDHLTRADFRNITVSDSRMLVSATGSAANVKTAFNTTLHNFGAGESRRFGNVSDAQVPAALGGIVLAVHGLQNAYQFHTMIVQADAGGVGSDARTRPVGHVPTDFPTIYHADGLPAATNARVGIITWGDMTQTLVDLASYEASVGFTSLTPTIVYPGAHGTDTAGTPEWDLDSQTSLSAAGGRLLEMVLYPATSATNADILTAFDRVVSDNHVKVVNFSAGECETGAVSGGYEASSDATLAIAVAQGQTFSISTGDSGSNECGRRAGPEGSYPAVSPYVMAIGGTTLYTTGTTVYKSEKVWRSAGGSPSSTEAAPSWQIAAGVLSGTRRGVPDISFDADPNSGAKIIVNGSAAQYGGTSLSAPIFTGFWARIMSQSLKTLGFPDPSIYNFAAANPSLFHDVTTGTNGSETAHAGWDYASGWGSVDIGALATFIASTPSW